MGLVSNPDTIHFTSASQDSLGVRYARLFYPLLDPTVTSMNSLKPRGQKQVRMKVIPGAIQVQRNFPGPMKIDLYDLSGRLQKTTLHEMIAIP